MEDVIPARLGVTSYDGRLKTQFHPDGFPHREAAMGFDPSLLL